LNMSTKDASIPVIGEPAVAARNSSDIELLSVSKSYGAAVAVNDVSFRLRAGEFLTLLGPSGSGKTSTLQMVAGFETPTRGDIRIRGESVLDISPNRRNLGVGFQSYALFPHMSAIQNVEFPLRMRGVGRGERRRRAQETLERVGLEGFERRRPRELSGGQQQRVSLARAIVFNPAALLLDEPLGALDKRLRERLQIEIRDLHQKTGLSVLYVTHDQDEAMMMSDRVAIMRDGRIEQLGTPSDVYRYPSSPFVAHFLGETNLVPCRPRTSPEHGDVSVTYADGTRGLVRRTEATPVAEADLVSVRPESVDIAAATRGRDNEVAGTVTDAVFLGSHVRFTVDALGQTFVVKGQAGQDTHAPGDRVYLGWDARAGQLLKAQE